jgi:hypothetical protein
VIAPVTSTSEALTVTSTAASFDTAMEAGGFYVFTCDVASWIAQGESPTATAADGSLYLPAGVSILLDGTAGAALSVIRASGDGTASLTRARVL